MTINELTKWFNDKFWPAYKELCKTPYPTKWTGGAKGEALKKILTLKPSEELRDRMTGALLEQMLHRRKLYSKLGTMQRYNEHIKFNKFYTNRDGKTWVFNLGWDDEIPNDIKGDSQVTNTQKCKCGKELFHAPLGLCLKCYEDKVPNPWLPLLRAQYVKDNPKA